MVIDARVDINLGTLLLEKKLITQKQLNTALEVQRIKGGYLSQRLIGLGYVKDEEVTSQFTCHYGFSYLPLKSYAISEAAIQTVPRTFISDFCAMPIEKNDKLLTVAMADPLNKGVIEMLRQASHCEIVVFVTSRGEIKEVFEKNFSIPFKNYDMDRFRDDIYLRDNLSTPYISNDLFTRPNHRRYKRLNLELAAEFYLYPSPMKTKIKNISMNGLLFETHTHFPVGTHAAINLNLEKRPPITGIIEVVRITLINRQSIYEEGAFFNFMTEENQNILADFLKEKLYT